MHKIVYISYIMDYIKQLPINFYENQLHVNELTKNITNIKRHNGPFLIKHKLPYQVLEIFDKEL